MKLPFTEYTPAQKKALFDGLNVSPVLTFSLKDSLQMGVASSSAAISVSGAQHKMSMVVRDGQLQYAAPGEQGTHILKPYPQRFAWNRDIPANEEFCMRMCREFFRLPTAASCLCFYQDGAPAYLTRRFDVLPGGSKLHMEDLASLSGLQVCGSSHAKYTGSYEGLAALIADVSSARLLDLRLFFRAVFVNFLLCNGDAHAKNFSMLDADGGAWRLAPVYDVLNTRVHVADGDFAMDGGLFENNRTLPKGKLNNIFLNWGEVIGLSSRIVSMEMSSILKVCPAVLKELSCSYMSRKSQSVFRYHMKQRLQRFSI